MEKVKDGVKAIVVSTSKILLFHRDNNPKIPFPDHWHIIGGGIEENEKPEDAVIRELKEEATYVPQKHEYLGQNIGSLGQNIYIFLFRILETKKSFLNTEL